MLTTLLSYFAGSVASDGTGPTSFSCRRIPGVLAANPDIASIRRVGGDESGTPPEIGAIRLVRP